MGRHTKKFWLFEDVPDSLWTDWKWQVKNRLHNGSDIRAYFPNLSPNDMNAFSVYAKKFHFALTPYLLSMIEVDKNKNPLKDDPIWMQVRFVPDRGTRLKGDYDGSTRNWEKPEEMPTPILHHKYPDRAIIRVVNSCFCYCNYCYLTLRVLDFNALKNLRCDEAAWEKSLKYLRENPGINDVLLSGGDPLISGNAQIAKLLKDLSGISSIGTIRLNTRALSFNPFRLDRELVGIFKRYRLTALEIHVSHHRELTEALDKRLSLFDEAGYRPMILWRAPLLRRVNADSGALKKLFLSLYERRIVPYYLFHYAPFSPGRSAFATSVRDGVRLLSGLRRAIPGPAVPDYTLFHIEGKHQIPLDPEGSAEFQYRKDAGGKPFVRFRTWKGTWADYPDVEDCL